ncbi:MAG: hypothetical protein AAB839_00460 [Patescibacteria group bacterium]
MTKGSSLVLRIYFGVVSAVTLFTLMFGAIDFLSIGLKTYIITSADVPSYLENCNAPTGAYGAPYNEPIKMADGVTRTYTEAELKSQCESRNAMSLQNYKQQKAEAAVRNLALIIVSLPLFAIHFRIVYRDWKGENKA